MARIQELAKTWRAVYCSTSIGNFKVKLARKFELPEWHLLKSVFKPAVFFGMYNPVDYFRLLWHRREKTIFWCGSDILNLQKRPFWQFILRNTKAKHICENVIEERALKDMGIESQIIPSLFDRIEIELSFKPSIYPHVYLCAHKDREKEYGVDELLDCARQLPDMTFHIYGVEGKDTHNVWYHGKVSDEQFNEEIKNYQAAVRLNKFDGFSEVLAKSVLMGQYPISRIPYPFMLSADNLVKSLESLKYIKKPNIAGRNYWLKVL